jgi:hypothetical protein
MIDPNEYAERSRKEEVCGIINCPNNPTTQCPKCLNYYCYEHLHIHSHTVDEEETEEERNRNEKLR